MRTYMQKWYDTDSHDFQTIILVCTKSAVNSYRNSLIVISMIVSRPNGTFHVVPCMRTHVGSQNGDSFATDESANEEGVATEESFSVEEDIVTETASVSEGSHLNLFANEVMHVAPGKG